MVWGTRRELQFVQRTGILEVGEEGMRIVREESKVADMEMKVVEEELLSGEKMRYL